MAKNKRCSKEAATINFDADIMARIDEKCKKDGRNRSQVVNALCSSILMSDEDYYRSMALKANREFQNYLALAEQAKLIREMNK